MHEENTNQENNKGLLWFVAIVNTLILIILAAFFAMSWNVITVEEAGESQQQAIEKQPAQTKSEQYKQPMQQKQPIQPLVNQQKTDKPELSNSEKECMDKCVQGGEIAPKCATECGIELPSREDENNSQGKCGDGVCDEVEQNNPEVCSEDCQ